MDLADGRGAVWFLKVTNEQAAREKVGAAIAFLLARLTEAVGRNPTLAPLAFLCSRYASPLEREDFPGFQNLHFAMLPQPAVWGVADGYLVVAISAGGRPVPGHGARRASRDSDE